jgi:hypothetical protein
LDQWSLESLKDVKLAYLTTIGRKSHKAHTVELWFAFADGKIYLSHEGTYTDWMRNLAENSQVRVRIDKLTLGAEGVIVKAGSSLAVGKKSLYEKYYGPATETTINDWFELSTIIELTPLKDRR